MTEYSRIAKGSVVTSINGGTSPIALPFIPDRVEFINFTAMGTPTATQVVKSYWDVTMGQGAAAYDFYDTGPVYSTATTLTGGISTFKAGLSLQYGAKKQIVAATKGGTTAVQVTNHGYITGDTVVFQGLYQSPTTGMPQISGMPFQISRIDANNFSVDWNTLGSNYTNLSGSPVGATVMKVLYPWLYVPGVSFITSIVEADETDDVVNSEIFTTDNHHFVVGQQVAFRIPTVWGPVELNSLPDPEIPGSPIYFYVIKVIDDQTFIVNVPFTTLTAFNSNQPVASVPGQQFPQVLAVGDVNSGGFPYTGGPLYPPPSYVDGYGGTTSTINGPAIQGAFVNSTSMGFLIGNVVAPTEGQTIYWTAYLDDFVSP